MTEGAPKPRPQEQAKGERINIHPFPSSEKAKILDQSRLIREQISLARKDIQPSPLKGTLQDRYTMVENILKAMETIANIDKDTPDIEAAFKNALTPLAERYGFQIVQGNPDEDPSYKERIIQYAEVYKATVLQINQQYLSFKNPYNANKKDIDLYDDINHINAVGTLKNHPDIQNYTSVFNHFSDTQQTILPPSTRISTPLNISGNLKGRSLDTRMILHYLSSIGKSVLWEGIDGNVIDPVLLVELMNKMLEPLNMGVDIKQPDPNQAANAQQQS